MTATDSSQLEPDLHHPETGPTQHAGDAPHSLEPSAESVELPVPVKASPPAVDEAPDSSERPRATRVAEGAWLGGVCTGLARHLGWPSGSCSSCWQPSNSSVSSHTAHCGCCCRLSRQSRHPVWSRRVGLACEIRPNPSG